MKIINEYNIFLSYKDDNIRERVSEIEQFWSKLQDENKSDEHSPYLTAFILSAEQLVLCQRLRLHAGLISYVILHNIEASSGLLQEINFGEDEIFGEIKQSILVSSNKLDNSTYMKTVKPFHSCN